MSDRQVFPATHAVASGTLLAGWLVTAFVGISVVLQTFGVGQIFYVLATFLILVFGLVHGALRYGWPRMIFFFVLVTVVSWSYESMSIMTGFPFGNYYYADTFPFGKVGLVPIMIMPAYFAMGYVSWTIASILLDLRGQKLQGADVILQPVLAGFVMVAWDMSMDPFNSTMSGAWVWEDGGAYFGVPFVNYLGWYLCVFTFFLIFALTLRGNASDGPWIPNRAFWLLPTLMYLTRVPQYFIVPFVVPDREITAADGHVWHTYDIMWSLALVSIFTMVFMAVYALIRVMRSKDLS